MSQHANTTSWQLYSKYLYYVNSTKDETCLLADKKDDLYLNIVVTYTICVDSQMQ